MAACCCAAGRRRTPRSPHRAAPWPSRRERCSPAPAGRRPGRRPGPPLSLTIATDVGDILLFARRYEEAARECRRAIQMDPECRQGHVGLGRIVKAQGDFEGAIREFLVSQRKDLLAAAYAMSGRREEALRLQAEITSKEPGNAGGWRLLASLGETDRAVAALLKQYEGRS